MLNLIFRTDLHVSDQNPVSWKGDYAGEGWSCIQQIGELAVKYRCQAVLDGGDYFHVKASSKNPHHIVARTAQLHRSYPCPVYSIPGNHDITWNNLDSLDKQPLGVLYAAGVFELLKDVTLKTDGYRVRLVGLPYSPHRKIEDFHVQKGEEDLLIVVAHVLAGEDPPSKVEEFFGEPVFRYGDMIVGGGADAFLFGHWHRDQGVVKLGRTYFINPGAVSRGTLSSENIDRQPKVILLSAGPNSPLTIKEIPLAVSPSSEVFDLEKKTQKQKEDADIDNFVERIRSDSMFDSSISIEENVDSLDFAKDVRERALHYLEKAKAEIG